MGDETKNMIAFLGTRSKKLLASSEAFYEAFGEIASKVPTLPNRRKWLKEIFSNYRFMEEDHPVRLWLSGLVELHQDYCAKSGSEYMIRQHNCFVAFYILQRKYTLREIAKANNVDMGTAWRNVDSAIRRLLVFVFGAGGVPFE